MSQHKRSAALLLVLAASCSVPAPTVPQGLNSFQVAVDGLFSSPTGTRKPLPVITPCNAKYGGEAKVPPSVRGTRDCPFQLPRGEVELDLTVTALDRTGAPFAGFSGPIAYRAVPGDLTGDYSSRSSVLTAGTGKTTLKVSHLYGEVRIWAEDAPPQLIYADGGISDPSHTLPAEPERRTFATGLSSSIFFEDPTLAKVQIPDGYDNRSSPLVGQFLTIGSNPESGRTLVQSCSDDPVNDGKPVEMVVTGIDPTGFFVADLTACRQREDVTTPSGVKVPEPSGFLPGTYGSMFVFNYSYPDGLDTGDLLFTLSGSIQEFTSTTQMVFPSWSIAEKVRRLPPDQWNKWLKFAHPAEINLRLCGLDSSPFLTDNLCGQNKKNLKLESLESGLVSVHHVRFPQVFTNCDLNANSSVPFFCETKLLPTGCTQTCEGATPYCNPALQRCVADVWGYSDCSFGSGPPDSANDLNERACNIECSTGQGSFAGTLCSERSTYENFGQYIIELAGPGPVEAGLDPSLPARQQDVAVSPTSARVATGFLPGAELRIWCDVPVKAKFGDDTVVATGTDAALAAKTLLSHTLGTSESFVAFVSSAAAGKCTVAENSHTRINLVSKDAIADFKPDCNPEDPDAAAATQCKALRAATYDIVGHLRHLQPGRPRWVILPRDVDDFCCHPGPGLSCPTPIKPCP